MYCFYQSMRNLTQRQPSKSYGFSCFELEFEIFAETRVNTEIV
jgi:hypothetical protein